MSIKSSTSLGLSESSIFSLACSQSPTVFSSELAIKPETTDLKESPKGLSCAGYGSSVNVTATFAFLSASYVLSNL